METISSSYYFALTFGYAIALLGWWLVYHWQPKIWEFQLDYQFFHPWWETLWALLAAIATVTIGQLYSRGLLIPEISATGSPLASSLNQIIIFSPFIILLLARRQPLTTAWLPSKSILLRLVIGLLLAFCALLVFFIIRRPPTSLLSIFVSGYHPKNIGYAVQVFLEDFAIAILFVRFRTAVGQKWFLLVVITVAFLFSAAHYPQKLNEGQSFLVATREVLIDGLLVSAVIYVLQRSRDFLWFWCIHFLMDMMQFYAGNLTK
jgi:hypothetical protein